MPNCNDLINKIYQTSTQTYDPGTRHYTFAFWLRSPYEQFYPTLEQKLGLRMGSDVLSVLDADTRDLPALNAEFRDIYDAHCEKYYHPSFNYVFVCAVDATEESQEKLLQMLKWIAGIRKIQDQVTVILTVPLSGNTAQTLAALNDAIFAETNVYLYTLAEQASAIRKNTLTDSISAVTIINSHRDMIVAHDRRMAKAMEKVNQIQNLADNDVLRSEMEQSERKVWSSFHGKYFDCRVDLFFGYCQELCRKVIPLSKEAVYKVMDDLYTQVNGEPEREAVLFKAINMIPMVEPPAKKKQISDSNLESRFDRMYGRNGRKTVDLSLKTTLARMRKSTHMMSISFYVSEIFRRLLPYRLKNENGSLLDEFKPFLEDYIREQTRAVESAEHNLVQVMKKGQDLDDESGVRNALTQYIRAYLDVYSLQTRVRFWFDIRNFLSAPCDELEGICREANENMKRIREFEEQCAENQFGIHVHKEIRVDPCTVSEVLSFLNGDESAGKHYQAIRSLAHEEQMMVDRPIDNRLEDVFECELLHHTYEDQAVQFVSETFTIRGYERNGKYIIG